MNQKNYISALLLLFAAVTASAQCPGPSVRTALINLQKAIADPTIYVTDGNLAGQVPVTDTCGNQRYTYYVRVFDTCIAVNPITTPSVGNPPSAFVKICGTDSIFYLDWRRQGIFLGEALTITQIIDSLQSDTTLLPTWYTANDTTTNLLRTASVLRSAWWRGIDSVGFLRWSMRPDNFDGSQFTLYQDSIKIDADTVIWASSWHPELQFHSLDADATYYYADSLKAVGLGQFPVFPSLNFDGTEKGFFYNGEIACVIHGNGQTGEFAYSSFDADGQFFIRATNGNDNSKIISSNETAAQSIRVSTNHSSSDFVQSVLSLSSTSTSNDGLLFVLQENAPNYSGAFTLSSDIIDAYSGPIFAVFSESNAFKYLWIASFLPQDTVENAVSFYNRAYYWKNEHPTGASPTDTLLHFWAATGPGNEAGKDPGFITLDQVCAHCAESVVNWYTSNGTTTDNTRIADVLETATWRSDNVTQDGIVPFRFELAGGGANEPENMVWLFPSGDSAMIYQADQEIVLFANNNWLFRTDGQANTQADSMGFVSNLSDGGWRIGRYGVITQNSASSPTHRDAIEYRSITGTSQTELFLDGSSAVWGVPTNSIQNFKIHVAAICSNAGNGIGISTGDAYSGWFLGGIKRVTNTTSLVGSVQADATAQADAGMSTSVVTIDADDTDESLRIRFTPPGTAGTTTVIQVTATIEITQTSY